jgi:outer membrane protein assembly factor BamA
MKNQPFLFLAWLVFSFCLNSCDDQKVQNSLQNRNIVSLQIIHTTPKFLPDREILALIRSQPGTIYSDEIADNDIRLMWESGKIEDAKFEVIPAGNNVLLKAHISTRPRSGPGLKIIGNSSFSDMKLRSQLWTQVSKPLANRISQIVNTTYDLKTDEPIVHKDDQLINEVLPAVCKELESFYKNQGFPDAIVTTRAWNGGPATNEDFCIVIDEQS